MWRTITVVSDINLLPVLAMYDLKHAASRQGPSMVFSFQLVLRRPPYLSALVHEMRPAGHAAFGAACRYQHKNGSSFVRARAPPS